MPTPETRERRRRHDGSEIDPVKSLAEFVQAIPASNSEAPEPEAPEPAPIPTPVQIQAPAGPTPEQIIAQERERANRAEEQLRGLQTQAQIDAAARRAVADQQQAARPAEPAPVDPRQAEIQEKWFTDPSRAQQLMQEMNDERVKKQIEEARGTIRQEVTAEQQTAQRREQGNAAFVEYRRRLAADGVPQAELDDDFKVGGLYQAVTRPSTPERPNAYYDAGGPLNADVLVQAWKRLYGAPAAPPPAQPPPPAPPPAPPIVAPPGSSRPAPAAEPPKRERATPVSADQQRDLTHMAQAFGMKPENLINRRRARLERDKGNQ